MPDNYRAILDRINRMGQDLGKASDGIPWLRNVVGSNAPPEQRPITADEPFPDVPGVTGMVDRGATPTPDAEPFMSTAVNIPRWSPEQQRKAQDYEEWRPQLENRALKMADWLNLIDSGIAEQLVKPGEGIRYFNTKTNAYATEKPDDKGVYRPQITGNLEDWQPVLIPRQSTPSGSSPFITPGPNAGAFERFNAAVVNTINSPLFNVAGVDISFPDLVSVALLGTAGVAGGQAALRAGQSAVNRAGLNAAIRSLESKGIVLEPETRAAFVEAYLANRKPMAVSGDLARLVAQALRSQRGGTITINPQAAQAAAQAAGTPATGTALTPSSYLNNLLSKLTTTNTGVPGQTQSAASIISGLQGATPGTARAVQSGVNLAGEARVPGVQGVPEPSSPAVPAPTSPEAPASVQQPAPAAPSEKGITTEADARALPVAGDIVSGLKVRPDIPNQASIESTLDEWEVLPGIREIPTSYTGEVTPPKPYSTSEAERIQELADAIKESGDINPLIVVVEDTGDYILEGSHRYDALRLLGVKSFPAQVVINRVSLPESPAAPQAAPAPVNPLAVETPAPVPTAAPIAPTAPQAPSVTPPAVPPAPPAPPVSQTPAAPTPNPSGKGITFADLQSAAVVESISFKPDASRALANLPGVREIMSKLNPSAVAGTPAEKSVIIRAVLRDEAQQKTQGIIAYLNELGTQAKVFGKLDKAGLIKSGPLKGQSVNDIRTYPGKYPLTQEQKKWVQRADDIERAKLDYLRENGIEINELHFMEGGQYAGRRVYGKLTADGELLDTGFVSAGPGRVGKKAGFEKQRVFASAEEAVKAGYRYLPDDEALSLNVQAAYNRVTDQRMAEWALSRIPFRTTGAPDELIMAAEASKWRLRRAQQLLAALNRANRGEKVPVQTVAAVAREYPDHAAQLQAIIDKKQAGGSITSEVKDLRAKAKAMLEVSQRENNQAVNARARAREKAMSPGYDEAMIMHPAFQGKVFTGPEAKATAETLRKALEPGLSKALQAVNKVNSVVRYFKLAGDMSPLGIQLLFLAGQNPKVYSQAVVGFIQAAFSKEAQSAFLSKNKAVIDRHPNLLISRSGNEFTEAMARGGILQQGAMKMAGKVLGPFQQGFEAALDTAGIEMAKSLEHLANTPEEMVEVDQFINEFRGLTSSAKLGVSPNWRAAETAVMLAPRYNRAIAALLYDAFKGTAGIGHAGLRGRLARNGLARGIAAVTLIFVAVGFAMGKDWEEIKGTLEPTSGKFLTYNIGGVNIGPGTKIRSVLKTLAEAWENPETLLTNGMENPFLRFVRGNLSPVLGNSIDLLTGRNYIGDPVRDNWQSFLREVVASQFIPIWVENVLYEGGTVGQRVIRGAGEFFGGRTYPETTSDIVKQLRDRYAAEDYGQKYEELNNGQKDDMARKHEDLAAAIEENNRYWSERGSTIEQLADGIEKQLTDERNAKLERAASALLAGDASKYDYDNERGYIRPYYSGGREVLYALREMERSDSDIKSYEEYLANLQDEDKGLNDYWDYYGELLESADFPADWDVIDREIETFLSKYPQDVQDYILAHKDDWIKDLPEAAKQVEQTRLTGIEDGTWWDNYRESSATYTPPSVEDLLNDRSRSSGTSDSVTIPRSIRDRLGIK